MGYIRRSYTVRPPTRPVALPAESVAPTGPTAPAEPVVIPVEEPAAILVETTVPDPEPNQQPSEQADHLRRLWTDRVWRTRNFYLCSLYNFEDLPVARSFLDQNMRDISDGIKTYYGNGAGSRIRDALENCFMAFVSVLDYVKVAPPGLDLTMDAVLGQKLLVWRDRSDSLFDIFASLNSATWNKTELRNLIDNDREFWWNQLQARHKKEWVRDLTFLDHAFNNAAKIDEMLIKGMPQ